MGICENCNNCVGYLDFLDYLDAGDWSLSIGIKDRMTKDEHLLYIERITKYEDALIEFVPNDNNPELVEKIDVYIKPTIRGSEVLSKTKHIQFLKEKGLSI